VDLPSLACVDAKIGGGTGSRERVGERDDGCYDIPRYNIMNPVRQNVRLVSSRLAQDKTYVTTMAGLGCGSLAPR